MSGLEQAANAFAADMGGRAMTVNPGARETVAPEAVFGNSDIHDDSEIAGGDALPPPVKAKTPKTRRDEEELDENDIPDEDDEVDPDAEPDEGDEEDDESKDGEEGDEEDDESKDPVLEKKYAVQIDGEEKEVTVAEALKGYMRQETFSNNMNFVDRGRQVLISEGQRLLSVREEIDAKLGEAEEILTALIPTPPNWDEEFARDPVKARSLQKTYDEFQKKIDDIKKKRSENKGATEQMSSEQLRNHIATEANKFAAKVKWNNAKARDKDLSSMNRTAAAAGFSPKEVAEVYDSRMLHVLWKASKYDRMMANKPKPVKNTRQQEPATPGAGRNRTAPKGNGQAMKRLRQAGTVESAIPVFQAILNRR